MLVFSYTHDLNKDWWGSIEHSVVSCLHAIAAKGPERMAAIDVSMRDAIEKYRGEHFYKFLAFQREKILQQFYKNRSVTTDIKEVIIRLPKLSDS